MRAIKLNKEVNGVAVLTMDLPNRSANVLNEEFFHALSEALDTIEADETITGVILISGKRLWVAGADIDTTFTSDDPAHYFALAEGLKAHLRRLETLGRPVVAALNGTALGGGLELALACHYRIALDNERIQFGFPEVGLGLLPGAGGVARTVRLVGLEKAMEWLTQNKKYGPAAALADGMIQALATDMDDLLAQAKQWIGENSAPKAPWDSQKYRIPGGDPNHPRVAQMLAVAPAMITKESKGVYPAPIAILSAAVEGAKVDFATACRIESRYFAQLAAGQISKNMINAFWTQLNQIKKGASRPRTVPPQRTTKVGVLGAGMMGHGIAYVSASAGIDVVLLDLSQNVADAGKAKIAALLAKQVKRGRMTTAALDHTLAHIHATAEYGRLADCDLVIEAVTENRNLKAKVTGMAESVMAPTGVFATNTSTLPITSLAAASSRPAQFIGLHFFSPVEKMQLVEIIMGKESNAETLAKAFDYVLAIGKVPIVVNDSRGFYTSRVFGTWVNEGMVLLAEGQHPAAIEMAGLQAGMPVGPLALLDELSLGLVHHIREQTKADRLAQGKQPATDREAEREDKSATVLDRMLQLDRPGRAAGRGFYEYDGERKRLWSPLAPMFRNGHQQLPQAEMIDRILFIQALETIRCVEEGVVQTTADANLGAILGWGFAPHHGGPLQYVNAYGLPAFVERSQELERLYGPRFAPPALLLEKAATGKQF